MVNNNYYFIQSFHLHWLMLINNRAFIHSLFTLFTVQLLWEWVPVFILMRRIWLRWGGGGGIDISRGIDILSLTMESV